ncbi:PAS domain S-box protein, partial [Thermodesulfobacteriota bacterium]
MAAFNIKTVKHKLVMGFLFVIVLFVSFGFISLREMHTAGNLTKMIYEHPLVVSNASLHAGINMTKMHRSMKDVALSNSLDELDKAKNVVNEHEQIVYKHLDVIRERIIGTEGQVLEKQTRQLFTGWRPIREEVFLLFHSGRTNEAASMTKGKGAVHVANLESKMLELTSYARKKADSFMQLAELSQSRLEIISFILVLAGVFLSTSIAFLTVRYVLKVEKVLQDSHEKYSGLFNSIRDAILVADTNRNIIDHNSAFNSLFGYTIKDLKGKKTIYVYESEEQFNELGKALKENYGKADFLKTVNYKKKTGEIFPGETGVYYLKDSDNNITGFIGLIRDITERKQVEKEREDLISDLQNALVEVKRLSGLLPICASCKKIRDDKGYWNQIETYIHEHSEAEFSHGICPECAKK